MATSFSGGRSRSTQREPPIMGKHLVNYNALVLSIPLNEIFVYISHCSIIFCNNLKGGLWCLALISTILQLYRGGQPHYCSSLHKMTVEITLSRAISWRLVLVVEEAGVHKENHRSWASIW
jgi:hypothetical protein